MLEFIDDSPLYYAQFPDILWGNEDMHKPNLKAHLEDLYLYAYACGLSAKLVL